MGDRRIKKTRDSIQLAFAKLLTEKSMKDITVKGLCETANINKSTFYLHYADIYDCADCLRDTIIDEFVAVIDQFEFEDIIDKFDIFLVSLINMFEKNRALYMPFLKSPSLASSSCKMKQLMIEKVLDKATCMNRENMTHQLTVSFIISGLISLLEQYEFAEIDSETISALAYKVKNGFAS